VPGLEVPGTASPAIARPRRREPEAQRAPLSVLRARAIYSPDPSAAALAKTKTGLGSHSPGQVKVQFCVGVRGKVSSATVVERFGSDPQVDRICRDAVKTWRFKPARVGGAAKTTCSEVTFDIHFEG